MKRISLNSTLFIFTFFVGVLGILGSAYIWGILEFSRFKKESHSLRENYIANQKTHIKERVQSAVDYVLYKKNQAIQQLKSDIKQRTYEAHATATFIYNKNKDKLSKPEISELIHDALFSASWNNGKGYYFAEDMQGTELINRNNPELEGQDISDLQDCQGVYIMQVILDVVKKHGEGFCSYHWNQPGSAGILIPKYSFVKYFKPMKWVIGNGKSLHDQEKKIKQRVLDYFDKIRVGQDGYIFLGTYDGLSLSYPFWNKNVFEITDLNGKKVVQHLIKAAKAGGGFVSYVMPESGYEPQKNKISYVMGIDDWNWYIGYGVYTDVIDEVISKKEAQLYKTIFKSALNSLLLFFILMLLALFFARSVAHKVTIAFNVFSVFFEKDKSDDFRISEENLNFTEFEQMAITVNKMLEERASSNLKTRQLQKKLEMAQKMEAIGLMAGGVAHDLNNTLSAIINIPELMLMDMKKDDPNCENLEMILDAGKRSAAIVKDMLTIGRGIVTKAVVEDLNLLIIESLASAEFNNLKLQFPEIKIKSKLAENPLYIDCSVTHIKKMIYNLVNNGMEAIKGKGDITISTSILDIDVSISGINEISPGSYYILEISDTGSGISEEDIEKIFEPFYTKKALGRSGTGLGLAIVWNTVVDHHAFIQVTSSKSGTKFSIYFPIAEGDHEHSCPNAESQLQRMETQQTILIVDDEEIQRSVLSQTLKRLKYKTISVSTGEVAVEFIKSNNVDLILLDMMLGTGMNGRETYQKILTIKPNQKVIVVTGYAMSVDVDATIEMGAFGCLHKPYSMKSLSDIITETLNS